MKEQLADIASNEAHKLNGFKVLGVFPFHLKYITVRTHVQLSKIRAQMQALKGGDEPINDDFHNPELQEQLVPLLVDYCTLGLLNNRRFSVLLRPFVKRKVAACAYSHILNLYVTIFKLNEPAFFLSCWKLITMKDDTLLKEETP